MASKEIIVNARRDLTRIALLEDGQLVEFHLESPEHERTIGNVYLGKVKKVMPNIRAAFVDVGLKQDAFLHFSDLTDNLPQQLAFLEDERPEVGRRHFRADVRIARSTKRRRARMRRTGVSVSGESARRDAVAAWLDNRHRPRRPAPKPRREVRRIERRNRLEDYLQQGQKVLAKIIKEPISHKGSRVSTDISLAGRFLVLVPLADYIAVSKKIGSFREKRRLRALAKSLVPDGFGVIVRTQASGKSARTLHTDLSLLVDKWRKLEAQLARSTRPPALLFEDVNMVSSVVRDLFTDDFERILVDDPRLFRQIKGYVQAVAPDMADRVRLHVGDRQIFDAVGIERDVRAAYETRVQLPSGGYLFIERTEAMHVVDVNSGRAGRGLSQEENALRVNVEAARAIARQLRLRDLGGIICVDFIDLRDDKNRRKVTDEMKREFKNDRAVTKLLPMSDFGVVQITRQRLRPSFTHSERPDETPAGWDLPASPPAPGASPIGSPVLDDYEAAYADGDRAETPRGDTGRDDRAPRDERREDRGRDDRRRGGRGSREDRGRDDERRDDRGPRDERSRDEANGNGRDDRRDERAPRDESNGNGGREDRRRDDRRDERAPREDRSREDSNGRDERRDERAPRAERGRDDRRDDRGPREDRESRDERRTRRDDPDAFVARIEAWLAERHGADALPAVCLRVHPFAAAYLTAVFPAHPVRWSLRFGSGVRMEHDAALGPFAFRIHDDLTGEEMTRPPSAVSAT